MEPEFVTSVFPLPRLSIMRPHSVEWIVAALAIVWAPLLPAVSTSTVTPNFFIGVAAVPILTPLPRVTIVASASLPRWWMTTPLLSKPPVRVLLPWAITTAGAPAPVPALRVTVRDVLPMVLCSLVLRTMPLAQPPAAAVELVIVVAAPPVTVSPTSPPTPLTQPSVTS